MPLVLLVLGPIGLLALVAIAAHGGKPAPAKSHGSVEAKNAQQFELDHGMPDAVIREVLTALVHGEDPAQLAALAHRLAPTYPLAASELERRSAAFTRIAPAPSGEHPSPGTLAPGSGTPAPPGEAQAHSAEGPDLSEPAKILQAAMRAYAQEPDPVSLDGFAQAIRDRYPMAAFMLTERAKEVQAALAQVASVAPPPAAPVGGTGAPAPGSAGSIPVGAPLALSPAAPSMGAVSLSGGLAAGHSALSAPGSTLPSASGPVPGHVEALPSPASHGIGPEPSAASAPPQVQPATYVVQPGDSASAIAEKLTYDSRRWPELVRANVLKPTNADGNFASLRPGETLSLPLWWPAPHPAQVHP